MRGTSPRSRSLALRRSARLAAERGELRFAWMCALQALALVEDEYPGCADEEHARSTLAWVEREMSQHAENTPEPKSKNRTCPDGTTGC